MGKNVSNGLGTLSAVSYLALGIACLIIWYQNPVINCGFNGSPPLGHWVQGAGIAYTIYGGCCVFAVILACTIVGIIPLILVMLFGGVFIFCWTIVGAVSLWRDGGDCNGLNYPLWAVAMATVIVPLGLSVLYCVMGSSVKNESSD